jgi:hypothetical protein
MTKIYLSGAITGIAREAVERKFNDAAELLKNRNYEVVNPLKVILNPDASSRTAMKRLVPLLLNCDAIYLLNDWQFSEGAKIEYMLAQYTGMRIMNEEDLN